MPEPTPSLPVFADGEAPGQSPLNALRTHLLNLYGYAVGGFRRNPKPVVSVRVTAENREAVTGTNYVVPFDLAEVDTDDMWAAISSNTMWVNTAGLYLIGFQSKIANVTVADGSQLHGFICVNGANPETDAVAGASTSTAGGGPSVALVGVADLNQGDKVQFVVSHNAGVTVGLSPDHGSTRAWAVWLGP